jgi:hypothetical protein
MTANQVSPIITARLGTRKRRGRLDASGYPFCLN